MTGARWLPAILWAALVFTLTSIPDPSLPDVPGGDKVAHTIMYGVLAALVASGTRLPRLSTLRPVVFPLLGPREPESRRHPDGEHRCDEDRPPPRHGLISACRIRTPRSAPESRPIRG